MKRLAIITTHPIQYYAPMFRLLQCRHNLAIYVFYTWGQSEFGKIDPGFGKEVVWDIPLLDGYPYIFMQNTARDPGSHHFKGIVNPNLVHSIELWKPDAVLVIGWAYNSHLKAMRYFKNKLPVLFRGDSTLLDEVPGIKNLIRKEILKWVYKHVDYALYPGANTKAYFEKYGKTTKELVFVPHAVDNKRFGLEQRERVVKLRSSLNLVDTNILILFAGKFEPKKAPLLLLKAFLKIGRPECHLLLVGNGILETSLKEMAGENNNVHFMDFQNQEYMPVVYQACDIFCLPSTGPGETWGLAVNEAMACAKPVLVSDKVGCAIDIVQQDLNGCIFESGKEAALLQCLRKMVSSKSSLVRQGEKAREIIESWNFEAAALAIENIVINEKI